jgi:hypothetical protein
MGSFMFARVFVTLTLIYVSLPPAQAEAQPYTRRPPAPAPQSAAAPSRAPAPAVVPRVSTPPRIAAPHPIAAPSRVAPRPQVAGPPRIATPSQVNRPARIAAPPRVAAPRSAPHRTTVPNTTPHVANPRAPSVTPRVPEPRSRPQISVTRQALDRLQTRELRREEARQVRELRAQQRQRLRDIRAQGQRPDRNALHQIRAQHAQQLRDLRTQFRERRLGLQSGVGTLRPNGRPRITSEFAREGRFASHFDHRHQQGQWRPERAAAHTAWRRHHRAAFVAWGGVVFWPYVYTDLFYYPFWPQAYDDAYWAYAYDDFVGSIYWAAGNPYAAYAYSAPTARSIGVVPGGSSKKRQTTRPPVDVCESESAITAWPFEEIGQVLAPTAQQQELLGELKAAAAQAANDFKVSCNHEAALTPTGRLQVMLDRLIASLNTVHLVRPPLMKFYDSLTDEQKARFNAIGPKVGKAGAARTEPQDAACSAQKSGLTELPIERIEDVVHPMGSQQTGLERLSKANDEAVAALQAACPDSIPQTPVGRLDAIVMRLEAMIQAAKIIQPALQEFYASLSDEQKSTFNMLGQRAQR